MCFRIIPRICLTWYTLAMEPFGCMLTISGTPSFVNIWWSPRMRSSKPSLRNRRHSSPKGILASEVPCKMMPRSLVQSYDFYRDYQGSETTYQVCWLCPTTRYFSPVGFAYAISSPDVVNASQPARCIRVISGASVSVRFLSGLFRQYVHTRGGVGLMVTSFF